MANNKKIMNISYDLIYIIASYIVGWVSVGVFWEEFYGDNIVNGGIRTALAVTMAPLTLPLFLLVYLGRFIKNKIKRYLRKQYE